MAVPSPDPVVATLAGLASAFGGLALMLLLWPTGEGDEPAKRQAAPRAAVAEHRAEPLEHYRVIVERPIFNPGHAADREAPVDPVDESAVAADPPPPSPPTGWQLVGLALSGTGRIAIVRPVGGGEPRRLGVGDDLEGWRVDSVGLDGVRLGRDDAHIVLDLIRPGDDRAR